MQVTAGIDVLVAIVRVVQLAGVEVYLMGLIDEGLFNQIFVISSILGIVPLTLQVHSSQGFRV